MQLGVKLGSKLLHEAKQVTRLSILVVERSMSSGRNVLPLRFQDIAARREYPDKKENLL